MAPRRFLVSVNGEGATGPQSSFGRTPAALPQCDFSAGDLLLGRPAPCLAAPAGGSLQEGPVLPGQRCQGKGGSSPEPQPGRSTWVFPAHVPWTRGEAHFPVGQHFLEKGVAPGAQGGWVRPGVQASCRGWAVAMGQGPDMGENQGPWRALWLQPGIFLRMIPKCRGCVF